MWSCNHPGHTASAIIAALHLSNVRTISRNLSGCECRLTNKAPLPLLDFYQKRGLLISIDAAGSPVETCQHVIAALAGPVLAAPPVASDPNLTCGHHMIFAFPSSFIKAISTLERLAQGRVHGELACWRRLQEAYSLNGMIVCGHNNEIYAQGIGGLNNHFFRRAI